MSFKLQRIFLVGAILIGSVVIALGLTSLRKGPEEKPIVDKRLLVEVQDLESWPVKFRLESQGSVQPVIQTALSAEVAGPVIELSQQFVTGGVFKAGETLLRIDPTNYQAAVKQAEAVLKQREIEFAGIKRLGEKGYRSDVELATAKAALATAEAQLTRSRRDLDKTRIRLPYDGMVAEKSVDLGQFVTTGAALGRVFATGYAEVRLALTESDLRFLALPKPGNDVRGDVDGYPVELSGQYRGQPAQWHARIVRTEGVVDAATRVTFVVAEIADPYALATDNDAPPLPVGTFVLAGISGIEMNNLIEIPRAALRGNDQVLLLDSENSLRVSEVQVVYTDADSAFVSADSLTEDRLVLTNIEAPVNGQAVRILGSADDDAALRTSRSTEPNNDSDDEQ